MIDQLLQSVPGGDDSGHPILHGVLELLRPRRQTRKAKKDRQRRAQLMAGHLDERGLQFVRFLQLLVFLLQLEKQFLALDYQIVALAGFTNDGLQLLGIPRLGDVAINVPLVDRIDDGVNVGGGAVGPDRWA